MLWLRIAISMMGLHLVLFSEVYALSQTVYQFPPAVLTSHPATLSNMMGAGTYTFSYSSVSATEIYPLYYLVDRTSSTFFHYGSNYYWVTGVYQGSVTTSTVSGTSYSGDYLQLSLPHFIYLTRLTMMGRTGYAIQRSPRDFVMLGSKDCSSWYLVATVTGTTTWADATYKNFTISSATSYNCYRMVVSRLGNYDSDSSNLQYTLNIAEFWLYGYFDEFPTSQPTTQPSRQPTRQPTTQPSSQPIEKPSAHPTSQPSCQPTIQPSVKPTVQPTKQPFTNPTSQPSQQPTHQPTSKPTVYPSIEPTVQPSSRPSTQPVSYPSSQPSEEPTSQPSSGPTSLPSSRPSKQPISKPTGHPTNDPTCQPSINPSSQPSSRPTSQPTSCPSAQPFSSPSSKPSCQPTTQPVSNPTIYPSAQPTIDPTSHPSKQPAACPTTQPSSVPTDRPTSKPTHQPSNQPTKQPQSSPSTHPTGQPTKQPNSKPTGQPSQCPTVQPSVHPTSQPSTHPFAAPSSQPSENPSSQPSDSPSMQPLSYPSSQPTSQPSWRPTSHPSRQPSSQPTSQPQSQPTSPPSRCPISKPSESPSCQPTTQPTRQPSRQPSESPTVQPSIFPSNFPSAQPSSQPSHHPFSSPTNQPSTQPSTYPSIQPTSDPTGQPTTKPSICPTSDPTTVPTLFPTIIVMNVVKIRELAVISSSPSSMTISVMFQNLANLPGSIFCASFISANLMDEHQIMSSVFGVGTQKGFLQKSGGETLSLNHLVAAQEFSIFCGVKMISGAISSIKDLIDTRIVGSTDCCRTISFLSAPRYLFVDQTLYSNALSSYFQQNIFSFILSAVPENYLLITPVLELNGSFVANASFLPRTLTCTPTDCATSFSLTCPIAGQYRLRLILSGSDNVRYNSNESLILDILNAKENPPAPKLSFAVFSDTGNGVYMKFDASTNIDTILPSTPWMCSKLWQFPDSGSSWCNWLNKTTVFALLPSRSILFLGDMVVLKPGMIRAECIDSNISHCIEYETVPETSIILSAPLYAISPNVVITGSSFYTKCSNATLDASGSVGNGGREWTNISWQVLFKNGSFARDIEDYLIQHYSDSYSLIKIIVLPGYLFRRENYYIRLALTNFLGKSSSASISFFYGVDGSVPMVKIGGDKELVVKPSSKISLFAYTELSSCASVEKIKYNWTVYDITKGKNRAVLTPLASESRNPWVFSLPSNQLQAGNRYSVQFCAVADGPFQAAFRYNSSAAVTISVLMGSLQARISGASLRYITNNITLDATPSYDENTNSSVGLLFHWSCTYGSGLLFSTSCDNVLDTQIQTLSLPILFVNYDRLKEDVAYIFTVTVSNRFSTAQPSSAMVKVVKVIADLKVDLELRSNTGAPFVVNYGTPIAIDALVKCSRDLYVAWEAFIDDRSQTIISGSQLERSLKYEEVVNGLNFPLYIPTASFSGGAYVQIRLAIYQYPNGSSVDFAGSPIVSNYRMTMKMISYSQISVKVNLPPQGGDLSVTPSKGVALETKYIATTFNWQDDVTDLPLTFDFRYTSDGGRSYLFAQGISVYSSVSMVLPAGAQSLNDKVLIIVRVYDIYSAINSREANVTVKPVDQKTINYESVLASLYSSVSITDGSDQKISVLNAVSSSLNYVNCSAVSSNYCRSLNRYPCLKTAQTCSSCFANYSGVVGDSNLYCHAPDSNGGKANGDKCMLDSDCKYGSCSLQGKCVVPIKRCPSIDGTQECGGSFRGQCRYSISGRTVISSECTILDSACSARCICNENYGGKACEWTNEQLLQRSAARSSMCGYLSGVMDKSDASHNLVDNLASSLLSIYDEHEVITAVGIETCKTSLHNMLNTALPVSTPSLSYLDMTTNFTANNIVNVLSKFVTPGNSTFINNATSLFVKAALLGMGDGQYDISLASEKFDIRLSRALVRDLTNQTVEVPLLDENLSLSPNRVRIQLGRDVSACDDSSGYASWSIGAFPVNPYPIETTSLTTSILRTESIENNKRNSSFARLSSSIDNEVAYYLSFPFTQSQNFSITEQIVQNENGTWFTVYNETIPSCTQFSTDHDIAINEQCSNCNVSSYSNDSVVFACYDITDICAYSNHKRIDFHRPPLLNDDDYFSMPTNIQSMVNTIFQAAALTESMVITIEHVLSFNPFAIDIEKAKGILAFVASLFCMTCIGIVYFRHWDKKDENTIKQRRRDMYEQQKSIPVENSTIQRGSIADGIVNRFHTLIDNSLPVQIDIVSKESFWQRYIVRPFVDHHDYLIPAGRASLQETRFLRWISFCLGLFTALFLDTLFFTIFFVDNGKCESYTSSDSCLADVNAITANTYCQWDDMHGCSLRPPPKTKLFSILVSCVSMLITVPLNFIFDYLLDEICAKRPDLEGFSKMFNIKWIHSRIESDKQYVQESAVHLSSKELIGEIVASVKQYDCHDNHQSVKYLRSSQNLQSPASSIRVRTQSLQDHEVAHAENKFTQSLSQLIDCDTKSSTDEEGVILMKIPVFQMSRKTNKGEQSRTLTWKGLWLRIQVDLHLSVPDAMTIAQRIANEKSINLKKLIERARYDSMKIVQTLSDAASIELSNDNDETTCQLNIKKFSAQLNQDLLQYFILEQLPLIHRYALKRQSFLHDFVLPDTISLFQWILGWFMIFSVILFFMYWTFVWCIYSGNKTFHSWGDILLANVLQDIFLLQVCKVYVLFISTQAAIIPYLVTIRSTLDSVAYKVYFAIEDAAISIVDGTQVITGNDASPESNVVSLDIALIQHFSPACRAARHPLLRSLPAALLLQRIEDADIMKCRQPPYVAPVGILSSILFSIPLIISMIREDFMDAAFEAVYNCFITSIYAICVLAFYYNWIATLIVLIVIACIWIVYSYYHRMKLSVLEAFHVLHIAKDSAEYAVKEQAEQTLWQSMSIPPIKDGVSAVNGAESSEVIDSPVVSPSSTAVSTTFVSHFLSRGQSKRSTRSIKVVPVATTADMNGEHQY